MPRGPGGWHGHAQGDVFQDQVCLGHPGYKGLTEGHLRTLRAVLPSRLPLEGWLHLTWPWYHMPVRLGVCPHSPNEVNRTNKYSTGSQAREIESLPHRRPPRRSLLVYQRCPLLEGQEPLQATRLRCHKGEPGMPGGSSSESQDGTEGKGRQEGRSGSQPAI